MVRGFCIGKAFVSSYWAKLQAQGRILPLCSVMTSDVKTSVVQYLYVVILAGGVLNLTIVLQILWYAKNTREQATLQAKKRE